MTTATASAASSAAEPALIPVVVAGALGRMGAEVVKAVLAAPDTTLVGAIDTPAGKEGCDLGLELGLGESLHISDLKLPPGVTSISLSHGERGDLAVVAVQAPKRAEVEAPVVAGAGAAAP